LEILPPEKCNNQSIGYHVPSNKRDIQKMLKNLNLCFISPTHWCLNNYMLEEEEHRFKIRSLPTIL
jgi:hypothetical protein